MAICLICSVEGCGRIILSGGLCNRHYIKLRRHGDPLYQKEIVVKVCTVDGCNNKHSAKGYCHIHYNHYKRHGDPLGGSPANYGASHKWLLEHLDYQGDECLLWPYSKHDFGYGQIRIDGKLEYVHTVVATIKYGPRPDKYDIGHSCGRGNLGCVNPRHLSYKTRQENCDDALKHGTRISVLKEEDVLSIVKDTRTQSVIAADYGINQSNVSAIKLGKSWSWLTGIKP